MKKVIQWTIVVAGTIFMILGMFFVDFPRYCWAIWWIVWQFVWILELIPKRLPRRARLCGIGSRELLP